MIKYWTCPNCSCDNEWAEYLQCGNCLSEFLNDEVNTIWQIRSRHEWYLTNRYDIICRHCGEVANSVMESVEKDNNIECKWHLKG